MLKVIMQEKARYILNKNPKIKTPEVIDLQGLSVIIINSANITQTVGAQFTTGGRLGVRLCQM